jgi:tetratricopeptide (TPR) repeat protein
VPLHIYGEYEYPVPPMEIPKPPLLARGQGGGPALAQLARSEAVSLFVACAQRVQSGFSLDEGNVSAVAEICARLDGLPLAIELAAARVKLFSPNAMLAHLGGARGPPGSPSLRFLTGGPRNAPARQRTLRAAIEWSYSLLDANEQRLFRRLSVFAGGFTPQAVEAVCVDPCASAAPALALDLLESLLDQSLLLQVSRSSPPRFTMLETVREYAWERLQESGEAERVRDRHTDHFCGALHAWGADLKGSRQLEALHEIELDLDNVRAAWEWAVGAHEQVPERAQAGWLDRALDGLCLFYEWRGRYEEGRTACQKVVDCGTAHRPAVDDLEEPGQELASEPRTARVGTGHAGPAPQDALPESLDAAENDVMLRVMARALAWQSRLNRKLGQLEFADRCFARALALLDQHTSSGHDAQRAFVLLCMAERASHSDLERARRLAERSLALYRALGDHWGMARALLHLGSVANLLGEYGEMSKLLQEGLALSQKLGDRRGSLWSLLGLGFSAVHIGQLEEGERLAKQAIAAARGLGDMELVRSAAVVLSTALHDEGRFAEARVVREEALAICRDHGMTEQETAAMVSLAVTTRHQGDYDEARLLTRGALSLALASGERRSTARCTMELSCLALAQAAIEQAEDWLRQSLALYAEFGRHWLTGELWSTLAYLACSQGEQAQARGHLLAALRVAVESKHRNGALQSLPAMSLLLRDQGGRSSADAERAVELYALAVRYPYVANSRWFEDVAGQEMAAAAEALLPDVVARAQERGRARDLWGTVEELLDELGGP